MDIIDIINALFICNIAVDELAFISLMESAIWTSNILLYLALSIGIVFLLGLGILGSKFILRLKYQ